MDWNAVATALAECARTTGLNALDYVPDSLPNEAFYVGEIDIDFDQTMRGRSVDGVRRGTDQATITCRVLIARADDKYALRKLRDYMAGSGDKSLKDAIEQDRTLGGEVHSLQVKAMRGNRMFVVGEKRYYGVELDVFVIGDA